MSSDNVSRLHGSDTKLIVLVGMTSETSFLRSYMAWNSPRGRRNWEAFVFVVSIVKIRSLGPEVPRRLVLSHGFVPVPTPTTV